MELALLFVTAFVVGLSGALMPGPLMTVTIDWAARRGFRTGLLPLLGHAFAEAAMVLALVFGLSQILNNGLVRGAIGLLGGAVLVWMGYGMGRDAWSGQASLALTGAGQQPRLAPVPTGVAVSVGNPYWLLWWATVGAGFVASSLQWGAVGLATFYGGHIVSDLAWLSLVAAVIVTGRRLLSDKVYRGLILVCGAFLVALGLYFFLSGVSFLRG